MIVLLTTIFETSDILRSQEIEYSYFKNYFNNNIDKIFIMLECTNEDNFSYLKNDKTTIKKIDNRPTYNQFITWATETLSDDDVAIIANSDIYMDDTIRLSNKISVDECWQLTRLNLIFPGKDSDDVAHWQLQGKNVSVGSSDVWIFKLPISEKINLIPEIYIGVDGCDTYFTTHLHKLGIKLKNPCYDIKTYHYHYFGNRNPKIGGKNYWSEHDYIPYIIVPFGGIDV